MSNRLVYSTDGGRVKEQASDNGPPAGDGIVRLRLETKARKGKGVTTITGLQLEAAELKGLAKLLKQKCSTGGTVKNWVIEIQGDHRDTIQAYLEAQGHRVKRAGG